MALDVQVGAPGLFDHPSFDGHEAVTFVCDPASGLQAIVAVHSTVLGPALGGTRWQRYPDAAAAVTDALRLSRAMTYKAAAAGLDLGGGKAVVLADRVTDRGAALAAYGRAVDRLGGRYLTAEDVGTGTADMDAVRAVTPYVVGVSVERGGSGDPSESTARGVVAAMRAACGHCFGRPTLAGRHVAVSGVGKVGRSLVRRLLAEGAKVTVADVSPAALDLLAADGIGPLHVVDPASIHRTGCDVFAPCALGGVLDERTIPELDCSAVVGSANNQLARAGCAELMATRGVVYVPDYVANAGGLMQVASEAHGHDGARSATENATANAAENAAEVVAQVDGIEDTVSQLLCRAASLRVTPAEDAYQLARQRLRAAS